MQVSAEVAYDSSAGGNPDICVCMRCGSPIRRSEASDHSSEVLMRLQPPQLQSSTHHQDE